MSDLDIAALRDRITNYRAVKWPSMSLPIDGVQTLLDAAEERDRLRSQRDALLAAANGVVGGFDCDDLTIDGRAQMDALVTAIAAAKETP